MNDGVIGDEFDGVIGVTSSVMPSIVCVECRKYIYVKKLTYILHFKHIRTRTFYYYYLLIRVSSIIYFFNFLQRIIILTLPLSVTREFFTSKYCINTFIFLLDPSSV